MELVKLGLDTGYEPAEPCPEMETPPPEPATALDGAIWVLEPSETDQVDPADVPEAEDILGLPEGGKAPEEIAEAVEYWVSRYVANPSVAARHMRELAARKPEQFAQGALALYEAGRWGEAAPILARLLSRDGKTAANLCDPAASLENSLCMAKVLLQHEPRFDIGFAKSLLDDDQMTAAERQRGMAILQQLTSGSRMTPILIQFLREPDTRVRSKAALMFGQIMPAQRIMERLMGDEDARVRANFVEGLWRSSSADCRTLFRHALRDKDHRVVGNALVGLHRLGDFRAVFGHLGKMARHPEPMFRAAAAWVMGQTAEDRYIPALRHMVQDPELPVRTNALRALRRINLASPPATSAPLP